MTLKLSPNNRHDAIDREEFKRMIESDPFKMLQARIEAELNRAVHTCVFSGDQLEVMRAQGAAAALETVARLPERLLDEMSNKPR